MIKNTLFHKVLTTIKSKPLRILRIFLLDIALIVSLWLINLGFTALLPNDPNLVQNIQTNTNLMITVVLLVILYFLFMVLAYSFFSMIVLGNIKSIAKKHRSNFSMFLRMVGLNLLIFVIFFVILTIFNMLLKVLVNKSVWIAAVSGIILLIAIMIMYAFHHFAHSAFIMNHKIKNIFRHSLKNAISKSYMGVLLFNIIVVVIYIIIYVIIGYFFQSSIIINYNKFLNISSITTIILIYLLYSFNRIYFYFIAEKKIGHSSK